MDRSFDWIDTELDSWREAHLERRLVTHSSTGLIDFASNDYLALARDPRVVDAACRAAREHGWGAVASPALTGWRRPHDELAQALAAFEQTEAALLFPSGYAALVGTITALMGRGDAVYLDRLAHACLFAGARQSGASIRVFPHNDTDRLDRALARDRQRFRRTLIATEGIFSMDGDAAPLADLVEIADRHHAMLLVDEAHATGILGPDGRGAASEFGVAARMELHAGTLSKALGSLGGFAAGSRRVIQLLVNRAPSFLFSTSLPPAAAAAAHEALRILQAEPFRRAALRARATALAHTLRGQGWKLPATIGPIIPLIVGDPARTLALSARLRKLGILVPAIRPPTVPRNSSRLRISMSYAHGEEQIEALTRALGSLRSTSPDSTAT
jgi:8-amino-7-oxononanoate synthase